MLCAGSGARGIDAVAPGVTLFIDRVTSMSMHTIRRLATALLSLIAIGAHAATLQLESPTLGKSARVKASYAQLPTNLPPGQWVQLQLIRLEGQKEDQVYARRIDTDKGSSGEYDFGPAYFPGRYEVRLTLVANPPRELARAALQVVEQAPAPAPGAKDGPPAKAEPPAPAPLDAAACGNTPAANGPVPAAAPTPDEVARNLRGLFSEVYAPIAGSAADVCVVVGTVSYRGQQERKMLNEKDVPVQASITSWVVSAPVTITVRKRHGIETRQRGGKDEVFLFFRDRGAWNFRTGRP